MNQMIESISRDGYVVAQEYLEAAAEGADGLLLVTEWREYRSPDFERLKTVMRRPIILDGRNQWDRARLENLGFTYTSIGR